MKIRLLIVVLLAAVGLSSACSAGADPPAEPSMPTSAGSFPDMTAYTPANPDDYNRELENPGRPEKRSGYFFSTPDGIRCLFGQPSLAACTGNNFPSIPPAPCDESTGKGSLNSISTDRGLQKYGSASCVAGPSLGKVLPPFHTLTVYGVTCGVDDKGTTACKDPQSRGFVLSPSWSGWIPKV